ncbi:60S ribosomal protein L31 [Candidatus Pacearchaeota archaeon]|nr:60S ribosomal protein L31 [Candidatus Pacearchaeota archaeon]
MAEEKQDNFIEREYTIPMREKLNRVPRYKRAKKAIKTIKEFLARHMKIYDRDLKKIKIDKYLNEQIWARGIKKPPAKIKIKAVKQGEIVIVELSEMDEKLKFKKARIEKREQKAKEVSEGKKKVVEEKHKHKHEEGEKTEESKEKEKTSAQETMKLEKETAKKMKHETKQSKAPKRQKRMALQK